MHEIDLRIAEPFEKRFRPQSSRSIRRYANGAPCAERNKDIPKPWVERRGDKLAHAKTARDLKGIDLPGNPLGQTGQSSGDTFRLPRGAGSKIYVGGRVSGRHEDPGRRIHRS